ncbi:hypothetical protein PQX77_010232 [Marasmius sp. AFHP31]|nr:hypothetical protein PQX77_010232 [Marasmius sp. AFHP31]
MPMPMSIPSPPPSAHPDADRSASPTRSPSRLPTPVSILPLQSHRSTPLSNHNQAEPEPEPTPAAEAPTPSPISRAPSTLTSISIRSAAHSTPMIPSIVSPILPPPQPQLQKPIDLSSSVLPVQNPTQAASSKHKQIEPRPRPPAPRITDVLANLKFTKRKAPLHPPPPVLSQPKRKRPRTDDVNVSGPPLDRLFTPLPPPPPSGEDDGERGEGGEEGVSVPEMKTKEPPSTNTDANVGRRQQGQGSSTSLKPTSSSSTTATPGPPLDRLFIPPAQASSRPPPSVAAYTRTPSTNTIVNVKRRQQGSSLKPTPVRQPAPSVEGPPLDRIFTPTPEPEPEVAAVDEVQKRGTQMKPSLVRSGVMTMKATSTSTSTPGPTAAGKSAATPSSSSSSSSLPPPPRIGKQSEPNRGASLSSAAGTNVEKSKPKPEPAVPIPIPPPPPSSSTVKVKQETSVSGSLSTSTSNDNGVIDLTFLDSDNDEEDEDPPKEREVIILSDSDDDDNDGVREVPRMNVKSEEGNGLDYGTGTSGSHSWSKEEVLGMDVNVDVGRGVEDCGEEGGMDVDVEPPDTNQDERDKSMSMQPEPSTSMNNDPPPSQMDVDHETPPTKDDTLPPPSPPVPITIKPDTPSSWDLHHIPLHTYSPPTSPSSTTSVKKPFILL